jgi:hypothetical protein
MNNSKRPIDAHKNTDNLFIFLTFLDGESIGVINDRCPLRQSFYLTARRLQWRLLAITLNGQLQLSQSGTDRIERRYPVATVVVGRVLQITFGCPQGADRAIDVRMTFATWTTRLWRKIKRRINRGTLPLSAGQRLLQLIDRPFSGIEGLDPVATVIVRRVLQILAC